MRPRDVRCGDERFRAAEVAQRDTGQSRRVANFLLSWWNAEECGGFDLTDPWGVDRAIAADMTTLFAYGVMNSHYPDTLGYEKQFAALVRAWRPVLSDS